MTPERSGSPLGSAGLVARWERDSQIWSITGWTPGPAGVASLDLVPGVVLSVDVAEPWHLCSLVVESMREVPQRQAVADLLGDVVVRALEDLAGSNTSDPVTVPHQPEWQEAARLRLIPRPARVVLAADVAFDLPEATRGVAGIEAAVVAAELGGTWTEPARALARAGARQLLDAEAEHGLPDMGDAHESFLEVARRSLRLLDPLLATSFGRWCDRSERAGFERADSTMFVASAPAVSRLARVAAAPHEGPVRAIPVRLARHLRTDPGLCGGIDRLGTTIRAPHEVEIRLPANALPPGQWWVRLVDVTRGCAVAVVPFDSTTGIARALFPPERTRHLMVDLSDDPGAAIGSASRYATSVAVAAGRSGSRADRLLSSAEAQTHWRVCAAGWQEVGDTRRAEMAGDRALGADASPAMIRRFPPWAIALVSDRVLRNTRPQDV